MTESATTTLVRLFHRISVGIDADRDLLSELDGAIGDADHGITMSIGFQAVNNQLGKLDAKEAGPEEVLVSAAGAFLDAVGASTGPLYASAFRSAAKALKDQDLLNTQGQAILIEAIANGIGERGKGQRGDKTMLDAWLPAKDAALAACSRGLPPHQFWTEVMLAARSGAADTKTMVAAKGRAVRLGERSLGHMDPGAASAVIILEAMAEIFGAE